MDKPDFSQAMVTWCKCKYDVTARRYVAEEKKTGFWTWLLWFTILGTCVYVLIHIFILIMGGY
jgi:hypothetical protein